MRIKIIKYLRTLGLIWNRIADTTSNLLVIITLIASVVATFLTTYNIFKLEPLKALMYSLTALALLYINNIVRH